MKVRRRVTLMVVFVTAIFGMCWGVNQIVHIFKFFSSYTTGALPTAVANRMVLVNSAINPFVFALLNQQFRERMKSGLCCTKVKVHFSSESHDFKLDDNMTHQISMVWHHRVHFKLAIVALIFNLSIHQDLQVQWMYYTKSKLIITIHLVYN